MLGAPTYIILPTVVAGQAFVQVVMALCAP